MEKNADKLTVKFWRALLSKAYDVLDKVGAFHSWFALFCHCFVFVYFGPLEFRALGLPGRCSYHMSHSTIPVTDFYIVVKLFNLSFTLRINFAVPFWVLFIQLFFGTGV
jgi:hypothetical protein